MTAFATKTKRPLVTDIGHILLQVGDIEKALRLYVDTLGFELVRERSSSPVWKVIKTQGGELTLYKPGNLAPLVLRDPENSPVTLHVENFEEATALLVEAGYKVQKLSKSAGNLIDPWGNIIGLHDHRQG